MALPEMISVEDFFNPPTRAAATISPDGRQYAFLAPWRNRLNVWVQRLDSESDEPRCVTADANRSVYHYEWTDDPRWLIYLQDTDGDENWHVHRIDLEDPDAQAVDLTPFSGAMAAPVREAKHGKIVVLINNRNVQQFDVHELDVATGTLTLLAENPGHVYSWLASDDGDLIATSLTSTGDLQMARWEPHSATLVPIVTFHGADYPLGVHPLVMAPDGKAVWVGSNRDTDRTRLVRIDLATGEETEVDSHPQFDLDPRGIVSAMMPPALIQHRRTGELIGARYLGERQVIHALDPHFAEILPNLEKLSDGDLGRLSSDDEGRRWIVGFNHDRDPGATYLYDHAPARVACCSGRWAAWTPISWLRCDPSPSPRAMGWNCIPI